MSVISAALPISPPVSGQEFKLTVCRRDYLNYEGLSDLLITAALVGHKRQGMLFNLDMTGTTFDEWHGLAETDAGGFQMAKMMLEIQARGLNQYHRLESFPVTIGRALDNDVILSDNSVSPYHVRLGTARRRGRFLSTICRMKTARA